MTRQTVPPPSAERPPAPRDLDELPVLFRDPPLSAEDLKPLPVLDGLPVFYEDEDEVDMGESNPHVDADEILHLCLKAHFAARPEYQVFSNLDVHYHPSNAKPYVSPDNLVVRPFARLGEDISSYRIGGDGPAPLLTAEILSRRSAQQRDLKEKVVIYANIGVSEYILVDISGRFLPQKLLLKRLQPDSAG
jgi:Uma2 family endonuclease